MPSIGSPFCKIYRGCNENQSKEKTMPTFKETFAPSHIGWPKTLFYAFATAGSMYYIVTDFVELRRDAKRTKAFEDAQD